MADLQDLYQQVIVEHNRAPRNFRRLAAANRRAEGDNPLCGDRITVEVRLEGDVLREVAFQGSGCAISQASASLMTSAVQGMTKSDAEALFRDVHAMLTSSPDAPVDAKHLGKIAALGGVRQFPMRVKCASLSWHTLRAALDDTPAPVSTE
jgi:nitrogen fixation NifU-like protein